ncbi:MAG: aminotransferase class I/II-fold pyridoxal phosphate-dependent enzyme [Bacteroidota bacterium]
MESPVLTKNSLQQVFNPNQFRQVGYELIDLLANHLENVQNEPTSKVLPYTQPEKELDFWRQHFAQADGLNDTFQTILQRSIKVHHPRYIGHQVAAPAPVSSLAGLMADLLSNGMGVYEMGMAANGIERVLIEFMNRRVGYSPKAGGIMTSGGTLANLTALITARKVSAPSDVWSEGHQEKLAIMVSEAAHYCIDRAARIMGLGTKGIIKIPVDERFKLRIDFLPDYLAKAKADGLHVFAVIGCASSTATGSYDDLAALADFCETENLWLHVDGAHGGGVVFSKKYKALAKGIHRADSIAIDFHKMLLTPALTTALLYKNGSDSYKTFAQKAEYLWDAPQSEEWYNSGKRTFECTKLMMPIKVYALLKAHGKGIFGANIDRLYDLGRTFAQMIKERPNFELLIEPEANIVNYRYVPDSAQNIDVLNAQIRQTLTEAGQFYIVSTVINGRRYLRSAIMNPLMTDGDLEDLLAEIERIGKMVVRQWQ